MLKNCKKILFAILFGIFIWSCSENSGNKIYKGEPYDPSKPVKIETYYPDSGGIATKVIIKGSNFGNNPDKIRVWYNKKRASVVRSIGNMIYVVTPKQPGDVNVISVVILNQENKVVDSLTFKQKFKYTTTTTVTTIAGKQGSANITDGTLAEAEFHSPRYLCVDAENNIFVSEFRGHALRQINEEKNIVVTIHRGNGMVNPNAPSTDSAGKVIFVPLDAGGGAMFEFDPNLQWAGKKIVPRKDPTSSDFTIDYKHSIASNTKDGMMYTRASNGQLIKFNSRTKAAFLVATDLTPGSDSFLYFDPHNMDILYIAYSFKHCIYKFNLKTKEHTLYAGKLNEKGWADGEREEAQFNEPRQICITNDGTMYIADSKNHCIRSISKDGIVTTVVGIPEVYGYKDGTPEDALFNEPCGIALDEEGVMYVADYANNCVRKLAIE